MPFYTQATSIPSNHCFHLPEHYKLVLLLSVSTLQGSFPMPPALKSFPQLPHSQWRPITPRPSPNIFTLWISFKQSFQIHFLIGKKEAVLQAPIFPPTQTYLLSAFSVSGMVLGIRYTVVYKQSVRKLRLVGTNMLYDTVQTDGYKENRTTVRT